MRLILVLLWTAIFAGCSASSHVLIGTQRPPIDPAQVRLYTHPPDHYEEVAIVQSSSKNSFSPGDQAKIDKVIQRLKEQAAQLGANGVLIEGLGEQSAGSVGSGFGSATAAGHTAVGTGFGISAGIFFKTGQGMAIYVPTP
ncbi:MAG: hypothetical protein WB646_03190 [Steroidobacteraceae bacterium]